MLAKLPRTMSTRALQALYKQTTGESLIVMLAVTHPSSPTALLV